MQQTMNKFMQQASGLMQTKMSKCMRLLSLLMLFLFVGIGSAWGETVTKSVSELATANNWSASSGSTINTKAKEFALDGIITVSTTGQDNCGTIWGSGETQDWRLYQNKNGNVIISASDGYVIQSVTFKFSVSNKGTLLYNENALTSETPVNLENVTSVTFTVGNSGSNTNGQVKITQFSVTYAIASAIQTKTVTSITVSGTAADLWKGDAFSHEGITVTASYEEDGVEDEDVTGVATYTGYDMSTAGNQTVTVTYSDQTATYTVNVRTIANTEATAYTVAEAKELIDANKDLNTEVYVTGIVSAITTAYSEQYGNISFDISADGETTGQQFCFYRNQLNATEKYTTDPNIQVGATVVGYGKLAKYSSTYELAEGNYLVSYTEPAVTAVSAELTTAPTKTTYDQGESLDLTGGVITVTYSDESTQTIDLPNNAVRYEGYNKNTQGEQTISFKYNATMDVTGNYTVMVNPPAQCAITWSVNGEATIDNQTQGAVITFPTAPADNGGYTFCGWTTATSVNADGTDISYLTLETTVPTANEITYYAVFAKRSVDGVGSVQITQDDINTYGSSGHNSYSDDYEINNFTGRWNISNVSQSLYLLLGYNTNSSKSAYNSHLTTPVLPAGATKVTIQTGNNTAENREFYLTSANDLGTAAMTNAVYGNGSLSTSGGSVTINVTGAPTQFNIYPNGTAYITEIIVEYANSVTYTNYTLTFAGKPLAELSFPETSYTIQEGDEFTAPTLTNTNSVTVTYSSSKTSVATVDENSGAVTIIGAGTTTITAAFAGDEDYEANTASYTLTVTAAPAAIKDGVFDFKGTQDYGSGVTLTSSSSYYETTTSTWTAGNVTMTIGGKYRWWAASGGNELRTYTETDNDATLTFSVPEGYKIIVIGFNVNPNCAVNKGEFTADPKYWTGIENEVTFTATSTAKIETITVSYVAVENALTVSADEVISENKYYQNVTVEANKTLTVNDATKLTVTGDLTLQANGANKPEVVLNGDVIVVGNVYLEWELKLDKDYPFTLPCEVEWSGIEYWDGSAWDDNFAIQVAEYDGAKRATDGTTNGSNWQYVSDEEPNDKLLAHKGYIMKVAKIDNPSITTSSITVRFPLNALKNAANKLTEDAELAVSENSSANETNAGWNYVGNPFLHSYQGTYGGQNYIAVTNDGGHTFTTKLSAGQTVTPFSPFFVQVASGEALNFATAAASMPELRAAVEYNARLFAELTLDADQMGIWMSDRYTTAYEINADFGKIFGSAQATAIYTVTGGNRLAYNALPDEAAQAIPVGFSATAGEHTLALREGEGFAHLYLTDKLMNTVTDLLTEDYTFTTEGDNMNESRFELNAVRAEAGTPTGVAETVSHEGIHKVLLNGKVYIVREGVWYDVMGKIVK